MPNNRFPMTDFRSRPIVWCLVLCHSLLFGNWSLVLGGEPLRLTKDRDFKQHLAWSPDGKKFLFTRLHAGKMGIWTMNADGGDVKALLEKDTMPHFDGCWSADSKRVIFVYDILQGTDGKLQI